MDKNINESNGRGYASGNSVKSGINGFSRLSSRRLSSPAIAAILVISVLAFAVTPGSAQPANTNKGYICGKL